MHTGMGKPPEAVKMFTLAGCYSQLGLRRTTRPSRMGGKRTPEVAAWVAVLNSKPKAAAGVEPSRQTFLACYYQRKLLRY